MIITGAFLATVWGVLLAIDVQRGEPGWVLATDSAMLTIGAVVFSFGIDRRAARRVSQADQLDTGDGDLSPWEHLASAPPPPNVGEWHRPERHKDAYDGPRWPYAEAESEAGQWRPEETEEAFYARLRAQWEAAHDRLDRGDQD